MSDGFIVGNQCLLQSDALAALSSGAAPTVNPSSTTYFSQLVNSSGSLSLQVYKVSSGVTSLYSTSPYKGAFVACDTSTDFTDGVTIGWGVAAAIIGAWGISYLKRLL
jgi:hypothetical protein